MAIKTEREMALNGEFLREYGKQYCLAVSEALSIGRVKWEVFPIGKAGKDGIVFYLTTEKMYMLCSDIRKGVAQKKIEATKAEKYPSAYKFATGKDACLHLNLGGGNVGCRVQMQDVSQNRNYTMAVSMEALENMAWKYMVNTGLVPVVPNSYYASLVDAFETGRKDREMKHKNYLPNDESVFEESSSPIDDDTDTSNSAANPVASESAAAATQTAKAAPAATAKEPPVKNEREKQIFTETVIGAKEEKKDFWVFNTAGGKRKILFKKSEAANFKWFAQFEAKANSDSGYKINFSGEEIGNGYVLFVAPAK